MDGARRTSPASDSGDKENPIHLKCDVQVESRNRIELHKFLFNNVITDSDGLLEGPEKKRRSSVPGLGKR
jgi:hypothetical protein